MAYLSDPSIRHKIDPTKKVLWDVNEVTLATCDLISSMLWNVDAVLYIVADVLLYNLHKKDSKGRKWLCEKLNPCQSSGDHEDGNEVNQIDNISQCEDYRNHGNESRVSLLSMFEGTDNMNGNDNQALLDGPTTSNYSTLNGCAIQGRQTGEK
eukprot:jgi/Psemu1/305005/fgenesh1_kg.178_\